MIGIVYDDGERHELPVDVLLALKALAVGYGHIKPMHAVYLRTFTFCFRGIDGYEITTQGRDALAAWDKGNDYDPRPNGGKRPAAPGATGGPEPGAAGPLLPAAGLQPGPEVGDVSSLRDREPEPR